MQMYFKLLASAFCAAAMLLLASCSDDDEPNGGNGGNEGTGDSVKPENVFLAGMPKNVGDAQIKTNAKGQVTEINDGNDLITFEYGTFTPTRANNFTVLMKIRETGYPEYGSDIYLELNKQGFVTYAYQVYLNEYDGPDEWWFGYNNDGQLNNMKRTEGGETYDITYTNGDITKVDMKEEDGDHREYTISYTNDNFKTAQANKGCVMIFDAIGIDMDEMNIAYYAGLLGKATKNLPMGYTSNEFEGGSSYTDSEVFNWTFNSNNLPTKFWEEGAEYDAITFVW